MENFYIYNVLNFFSLLLLIGMFFHANYYFKNGYEKKWRRILFIAIITQVLDISAYFLNTLDASFIPFSYICNILLFLFESILSVNMALFLYYTIDSHSKSLEKFKKYFNFVILFNFILIVSSLFFNTVFTIDANNVYSRGPLYFIMVGLIFTPLIIIVAKIILNYFRSFNKAFVNNRGLLLIIGTSIIGLSVFVFLQGSQNMPVTIIFACVTFFLLIIHLLLISNVIMIDYLTKIQNKFGLETYLSQLPKKTSNYIVAIFFDLDNFKQVNDMFGHKEGDKVLVHFAKILSEEITHKDLVARIGGDEFLIMLRTKDLKQKDAILNTVKENIEIFNKQSKIKLTYSYGVSITKPSEPFKKEIVLEEADRRMYENKNSKKNNAN